MPVEFGAEFIIERSRRAAWLAMLMLGFLLRSAAPAAAEEGTLTVATFGGAYGQSQAIAYFTPFTQATGTKVDVETYDGTLAAIKDRIGGSPAIDLVDLSPGTLDALCKDGQLEPIDGSLLTAGADGKSAAEDFLAGGLPACGIASVAWSAAVVFDRQAFGKNQPNKIADLLDLQRFPGKRALPGAPRYTLELALLADGVPPENIYSELGTQAGADRAFAALDKIKPQIVWWDKSQDALDLLLGKKAAMAVSYSGRIFPAATANRQRLDVLWDGQIYDLDVWAIPKAGANKDKAKSFIAFASDPARLAAQARLIAYGPMRQSAIALVGKHPDIGVEMASFLPTAPEHMKHALKLDEAWWNEHGDELTKRFQAWRDQSSAPAGAQTSANPSPGQ